MDIENTSATSLRLTGQLKRRNEVNWNNVFSKNTTTQTLKDTTQYRNTQPRATNANPKPVTTAIVPYISSTSETVVPTSLRHRRCSQTDHFFVKSTKNVKDKDKPRERQGAVYKNKCCDYRFYFNILSHTYSSETGRKLNTGLTDHKRATTKSDLNTHIAEHHLQTNHSIKWASAVRITTNN